MELIAEFGSNTCKVMQCKDNRVFVDYRIPLRLISHLDADGKMKEAAVSSILSIISDIKKRFPEMQNIILVGTEAMRRATNNPEIVGLILEKTGLNMQILSVKEEAEAAHKGIMTAIEPKGNILAFDIGGASTEIIYGRDARIKDVVSLPFGAVSLNDKFRGSDPYTNCAFHALEMFVETNLKIRQAKDYTVIGTGGSLATMAAVMLGMKSFDAEALNGTVISRAEVLRQVLMYRPKSVSEICKIPGMDPARADLMLPASYLVCQIIHKAGVDRVIVSTRGVRHGIICEIKQQQGKI